MCCAGLKGKMSKKKKTVKNKTMRNNFTIGSERCPLCQAPLQPIFQQQHIYKCLNTCLDHLPECPEEVDCHSSDVQHYSVFKHHALARILAGASSGADAAQQLTCGKMEVQTDEKHMESTELVHSALTSGNTPQAGPPENSAEGQEEFGSGGDSTVTCDGTTCHSDSTCLVAAALEPTDLAPEQHSSVSGDCLETAITCGDTKGVSAGDSSQVDSACVSSEYITAADQQTDKTSTERPVNRNSSFSGKSNPAADVTISQSPRKCSSQSSIRSFFKPAIESRQKKQDLLSHSGDSSHKKPKVDSAVVRNVGSSVESVSSNSRSLQTTGSIGFTQGSTTSSGRTRKCPFYKWIPGTSVTVDAFSYGSIPGCSAYFLSHFHADHYSGLNKSFKHKVYCSQVTANLIRLRLKVASHLICPLPLDVTLSIGEVEVTLLDANHCPGSVMFLFKKKSHANAAQDEYILHVGDFRAHKEMLDCPQLQSVHISQLFLDTTYCDPSYIFPCQKDVINFAVHTTVEFLQAYPDALVVVGAYTIGKERLFRAIADTLDCKICVTKDKKSILDCLEDELLCQRLTLKKDEARVHVVPMNLINVNALTSYLDSLQPQFDHVLAFEPTGWTYSNKMLSVENIRPRYTTSRITIYGVPYSEHSSYDELRAFVQFTCPSKIIPTVNNGSAQSRQNMAALFSAWLSAAGTAQQTSRQTAVSSWFT